MRARFERTWAKASRANLAASVGVLLALSTSHSASRVLLVTPEQRRASMPEPHHLCAGEIPNVRAITNGLRRQKAGLSETCRPCSSSEGPNLKRAAVQWGKMSIKQTII
jgi:hypothetical protein